MKFKRQHLFILFILICTAVTFGRAGGAGSSRSSSSSSSSRSSSSSSYGSSSSSSSSGYSKGDWKFYLAFIGLVIVINAFKSKKSKNEELEKNHEDTLRAQAAIYPDGNTEGRRLGFDTYLVDHPDFDEVEFNKKVSTAFMEIQHAWSEKDIRKVRHFLSDGMYQKFTAQFTMMNQLEQVNTLSDVSIVDLFIDSVESDGDYDIIHVGIDAQMNDSFICDFDPTLNSDSFENFVEYWSFIRKKSAKETNIYNNPECPSCGGILSELGEQARCSFCDSLINGGEFDWVLSEISQAREYVASLHTKNNFSDKRELLAERFTDFSIQHIEDTVSNGYMQYLVAQTTKQPNMVRRFTTDKFYTDTVLSQVEECSHIFNRLYTNEVAVYRIELTDVTATIDVRVTYTSQRVEKFLGKLEKIDLNPKEETSYVRLIRNGSFTPRGNLYQHSCASCGAPVENSDDTSCPYCSTVLNDSNKTWIISGIYTPHHYRKLLA